MDQDTLKKRCFSCESLLLHPWNDPCNCPPFPSPWQAIVHKSLVIDDGSHGQTVVEKAVDANSGWPVCNTHISMDFWPLPWPWTEKWAADLIESSLPLDNSIFLLQKGFEQLLIPIKSSYKHKQIHYRYDLHQHNLLIWSHDTSFSFHAGAIISCRLDMNNLPKTIYIHGRSVGFSIEQFGCWYRIRRKAWFK